MKIVTLYLCSFSIVVLLTACAKEQNCEIFNYTLLESRALSVEMARSEFLAAPNPSTCQTFIDAQHTFDQSADEFIDLSSDCDNIPVDSVITLQFSVRDDYGDEAAMSLTPLALAAAQEYQVYLQEMTQVNCLSAKAAYQTILDRALLYDDCYQSEQVEDFIESLTLVIAGFPCG